jgi:hypothetical protein
VRDQLSKATIGAREGLKKNESVSKTLFFSSFAVLELNNRLDRLKSCGKTNIIRLSLARTRTLFSRIAIGCGAQINLFKK